MAALSLLEALAPRWLEIQVYSRLAPIAVLFGGVTSVGEARELFLVLAGIASCILFGVWLYNRWTVLRCSGLTGLPAWLAVLLCVIPVISIPATPILVTRVLRHWYQDDGKVLSGLPPNTVWIWWLSYLASGVFASLGVDPVAERWAFGLMAVSLVAFMTVLARTRMVDLPTHARG